MNTNKKTLWIAQVSIFAAVELIFCFTPLGSLPITPGIVATSGSSAGDSRGSCAGGYSAAAVLAR